MAFKSFTSSKFHFPYKLSYYAWATCGTYSDRWKYVSGRSKFGERFLCRSHILALIFVDLASQVVWRRLWHRYYRMIYANVGKNLREILTSFIIVFSLFTTCSGQFCTRTWSASIIACENIRFSSLFVAEDVSFPSRETSLATKSEEKRMFSQATSIRSLLGTISFIQELNFDKQ